MTSAGYSTWKALSCTAGVGISPTGFSARMRIRSGLVYTPCLSTRELDLWAWNQGNPHGAPRGRFGLVAEVTGVQIVCHPGQENGVDLTTNGWQRRLPNKPDETYEIRLRNRCNEQGIGIGTHFRALYQLGSVVVAPGEDYADFKISGSGTPIPQIVCNGAFGGTI